MQVKAKMIHTLPRMTALAVTLVVGAANAQSLTVCMAQDNSPLSYVVKDETRGLDLRVAQAVAAELNRPLQVVLFESKYEADSSLSHEVNALLSSGVCDFASGFPLVSTDLGAPSRATARVPDHPGAKRLPQRAWVPLGTLVPSLAYHTVAMGLIVREPSRETATLADLGDARIGVTAGTMAGTAVTLYRKGKLRPQLVSLAQNQDALAQLDAGAFDATVVSLDRYDAWRLIHPASSLRRTPYVHPLRINIGFVARTDAPEVMAAANRVIERSLTSGELQAWSTAAGVSWIAPIPPQVSGPIGMASLVSD